MTYAVLGSTGQVGGSILEVLLQSPKNKIHALARSKQKLLRSRPDLETFANVSIYEGSIQDIDVLQDCITGTDAVFLAAGASDNIPNCDIAQQKSKSVVQALKQIRAQDPNARLPQLVVLSSSSLEKKFIQDMPAIAQWMLHTASSFIYADLQLAEDFLRTHEWVKQVYIKPGGLVNDTPKGHILSTARQQTFLSFLDLAAGMVEVADADHDKWDMQNVSVLPASSGTKIEWRVPYYMLKGSLYHFVPWLHPYLSGWLP